MITPAKGAVSELTMRGVLGELAVGLVFGLSLMLLSEMVLFAGALTIGVGSQSYLSEPETIATKPPALGLPVEPGTAVGDLQALDRNDELYADFDVLDDLQVQDDVTANP